MTFAHAETEKTIQIEILEKENDVDERSDLFTVKIFDVEPDGAKIGRKDRCFIEIVGENGNSS